MSATNKKLYETMDNFTKDFNRYIEAEYGIEHGIDFVMEATK